MPRQGRRALDQGVTVDFCKGEKILFSAVGRPVQGIAVFLYGGCEVFGMSYDALDSSPRQVPRRSSRSCLPFEPRNENGPQPFGIQPQDRSFFPSWRHRPAAFPRYSRVK